MLKVLVVEDDESLCVLLHAALRREGLDVECVGAAETAMRLIERDRFDAVVVDLILQGSSGSYVIAAVRKMAAERRPRVIVITGAGAEAIKAIDRTVAKTVMFKPLDLVTFAPVVKIEAERAATGRSR